ncbi:MAG: thioredoxin domain-containing protein, partial [Nitrospinae bacterium]|nr:thioredoxin domain-containing protein [Nitrospinota bacterium]
MPKIEKEYIETGKVKYVFRDFPIKQLHPNAFKAAEAANCSAEQGKYWEMHARLFANQRALGPEDLSGHAEALGLDLSKFQPCLA